MFLILLTYIFIISIIKIKTEENLTENNPNIGVIPFKTFYPPIKYYNNKFSSNDYFDTIHSSNTYIEIEVGANITQINISKEEESKIIDKKQILSLFLVIDDYLFYIDDNFFYNDEKAKICRYSSKLSTSYEIVSSENKNDSISIYVTDYFKIFLDLALEEYDMIKMEFLHYFDKSSNIYFACGKAGLILPTNKFSSNTERNFINQIHKSLKNVDLSFTLKFNKNKDINEMNDGLFIVGIESYEKGKHDELISIYTKPDIYGSKLNWRFGVDQITIGNKLFELNGEEFIIKTEIEGIEIPLSFYDKLNISFFNNYYSKKICQYDEVNYYFIIISCNSDIFSKNDIDSFPQINILVSKLGFNFTFSGEELFYKKDNNYFFKMIPNIEKNKKDFKLGRMFLKKYQVIFNSDSKTMSFYKNNNLETDVTINESKNNIGLLIFSYILIGFIFLGVGIYFGTKFYNFRRKKKANELEDDDYIYESKDKNNKEERKLIE